MIIETNRDATRLFSTVIFPNKLSLLNFSKKRDIGPLPWQLHLCLLLLQSFYLLFELHTTPQACRFELISCINKGCMYVCTCIVFGMPLATQLV